MTAPNINKIRALIRLPCLLATALALLPGARAYAAAPGITGPAFNLTAQPASISQPDGQMVYSWGYGCNGPPSGLPAHGNRATPSCGSMQVPGPTLIVHENDTVTVTLTNNLPPSAGNTSILFPGFQVTAAGRRPGAADTGSAPGATVTYTFKATSPGTRAYYSGTQGDLQVEMGLYGAIIVLPAARPRRMHGAGDSLEPVWDRQLRQYQRTGDREGLPPGELRLRSRQDLLRPRISVPVLGDGSQHPHAGAGAGHRGGRLHGRGGGVQPQCTYRALPSGVLHDQRALDAR